MSGELALGMARGFRQRVDENQAQQIQADERARQTARQNAADARSADTYAYEQQQRPAREALQQSTLANTLRTGQAQQKTLADAAKAAHDEGFVDLMDQLGRGVDSGLAVRAYNARGTHKIDPTTFKYDPRSKNVSFVDDDGTPVQGNVDAIKGVLTDSLTPSTAKHTLTKVGDHEKVIDGTGKEVARGDLYGKEKTSGAVIKGKSGDWYRDPADLKWKQIPGKAGKGSSTLPGGSKMGTWSQQGAQKSVREIIAKQVGLKYDPETEQIVGGKPGATDRWVELSALGDGVIDRVKDTMGPAQIAHMVGDAYSGVLPIEDYKKLAAKDTKRMQLHDPTKPDNMFSRQESAETFDARINESAKKMKAAAESEAQAKLEKNLMPFIPAVDDGSGPGDEGSADEGDTGDEEATNADDDLPAVDPADGTAAAGQAPAALGPRAHYPVTIDRVTADPDPESQAALNALHSQPQILKLLTTPAASGKATVVRFPDGNGYYLAGTQIKKLHMKLPAKGK